MKLCPTCMADLKDSPPPDVAPPVSMHNLKLLWCEPCAITWNEEYLRGFWAGFRTSATLNKVRQGMKLLPLTPPAYERLQKRVDGYERMNVLFNGPSAPPRDDL